jgi:hypothetical protein
MLKIASHCLKEEKQAELLDRLDQTYILPVPTQSFSY